MRWCLVFVACHMIVAALAGGAEGGGERTTLQLSPDYFSSVLDQNHDGFLDEAEATLALTRLSQQLPVHVDSAHEVFVNGDINADGRLDLEEARAVLTVLLAGVHSRDETVPTAATSPTMGKAFSAKALLNLIQRQQGNGVRGDNFRVLTGKICGQCLPGYTVLSPGYLSASCSPAPSSPTANVAPGTAMTVFCKPGWYYTNSGGGANPVCMDGPDQYWSPDVGTCNACTNVGCATYSAGCTCTSCNPGYTFQSGVCNPNNYYERFYACYGQWCNPYSQWAVDGYVVNPPPGFNTITDFYMSRCQDRCNANSACTAAELVLTSQPSCFLYNFANPCSSGCTTCTGSVYCQSNGFLNAPQGEQWYWYKRQCVTLSCGAGQYVDLAVCGKTQTGCTACGTTCAVGTGINAPGGSACTATANRVCAPCPSGQFNPGNSLNCQPCSGSCSANQWVDLTVCGGALTGCTACGTTCAAGTGINGDGGSACAANADRVCVTCPANQFNTGAGLSCQPCATCSAGTGTNGAGGQACSGSADNGICGACVSRVNYNPSTGYACTPCSSTCPANTGSGPPRFGPACTPTADRICTPCTPGTMNNGNYLACQQY